MNTELNPVPADVLNTWQGSRVLSRYAGLYETRERHPELSELADREIGTTLQVIASSRRLSRQAVYRGLDALEQEAVGREDYRTVIAIKKARNDYTAAVRSLPLPGSD